MALELPSGANSAATFWQAAARQPVHDREDGKANTLCVVGYFVAAGTINSPGTFGRSDAGGLRPCDLFQRPRSMMDSPSSPGRSLGKAIAAVAIAVFWCFSAVGTTVGVTTLATAVTAATSTPAEAGRWRGRGWGRGRGYRRWRGRGWYGGYPYYRRGWYGYPYYRRGWYGPRFGIWFGF